MGYNSQKIAVGVIVLIIVFASERGTEMMFPDWSAWTWWGIAVGTGALYFILCRPLWRSTPVDEISAEPVAEPSMSVSSNGQEAAKMILRCPNPIEVQKIYDEFNLLPHKYDEIYVHQAFVRNLEKAGEIEQADAVYESSPHLKGSTRKDAIRFALLVHEVENEA